MNSEPSRVLVVGLDPYRVPGPWDPDPVAAAIETGMKGLAAHGISAEACLVGLDGSDEVEVRVVEALRSSAWHCVVVGGGLRKGDALAELFQSIVNLVRTHAPQAVLAFNERPSDLWGPVSRSLSGA